MREQHKMPPEQKKQQEQAQPGAAPKDDPRMAFEEGDPLETGRSRGHVVDRDHPAGEVAPKTKDVQEDWESGRQDAMS